MNRTHTLQRFVFLLLTFFSFDVLAQVMRPTSFDGRAECEKSRGVWRQFGNGCADECNSKFDEFTICTEEIISGCDCGKGRCWNGEGGSSANSCVSLSEYQKIFDRQQEVEKEILDKAKKERLANFKKHRRKMMEDLVQKGSAQPGNNLANFYGNTTSDKKETATVQAPSAPPQKSESSGGLASMIFDKKSVSDPVIVPAPQDNSEYSDIPPDILNKMKANQQTATKQQGAVVDADGIIVEIPQQETAKTPTSQTQTNQTPKIGSYSPQDPNQQLIPKKSLITPTSSSGLPQLPMP